MIISGSILLSELIPISGVYKISCLKNGKVYIGQSNNVLSRWSEHIKKLITGKHENKELQKDFQIHGLDNFSIEVIQECENNPRMLLNAECEQMCICATNGYELYNSLNSYKWMLVKEKESYE